MNHHGLSAMILLTLLFNVAVCSSVAEPTPVSYDHIRSPKGLYAGPSNWASPQARPPRARQGRVINFRSGLWQLMDKLSLNDFEVHNSGLENNFRRYYTDTSKTFTNGRNDPSTTVASLISDINNLPSLSQNSPVEQRDISIENFSKLGGPSASQANTERITSELYSNSVTFTIPTHYVETKNERTSQKISPIPLRINRYNSGVLETPAKEFEQGSAGDDSKVSDVILKDALHFALPYISPDKQSHMPSAVNSKIAVGKGSEKLTAEIPPDVVDLVSKTSSSLYSKQDETMEQLFSKFKHLFEHAERVVSDSNKGFNENLLTKNISSMNYQKIVNITSPLRNLIIVYKPVIFLNEAGMANSPAILGHGYRPTILTEESGATVTKEALKNLDSVSLDQISEKFVEEVNKLSESDDTGLMIKKVDKKVSDDVETYMVIDNSKQALSTIANKQSQETEFIDSDILGFINNYTPGINETANNKIEGELNTNVTSFILNVQDSGIKAQNEREKTVYSGTNFGTAPDVVDEDSNFHRVIHSMFQPNGQSEIILTEDDLPILFSDTFVPQSNSADHDRTSPSNRNNIKKDSKDNLNQNSDVIFLNITLSDLLDENKTHTYFKDTETDNGDNVKKDVSSNQIIDDNNWITTNNGLTSSSMHPSRVIIPIGTEESNTANVLAMVNEAFSKSTDENEQITTKLRDSNLKNSADLHSVISELTIRNNAQETEELHTLVDSIDIADNAAIGTFSNDQLFDERFTDDQSLFDDDSGKTMASEITDIEIEPIKFAHNIILIDDPNVVVEEIEKQPVMMRSNLENMNPGTWWISQENNSPKKKYIIKKIVKRRKTIPSKLRKSIFQQSSPFQLQQLKKINSQMVSDIPVMHSNSDQGGGALLESRSFGSNGNLSRRNTLKSMANLMKRLYLQHPSI